MILSGLEIEKQINLGRIKIDSFDRKRLNPNSYNLRLHNELYIYIDKVLDMKNQLSLEHLEIPPDGLILEPGRLYLGRTCEHTETDFYVPMLEGRSSTGRLGLNIHVTAGFGDIGFHGYWTLEIQCVQPVKIYPFVEICQIYYHMIQGEYEKYSSKKYQDNKGIEPSKMYMDLRED